MVNDWDKREKRSPGLKDICVDSNNVRMLDSCLGALQSRGCRVEKDDKSTSKVTFAIVFHRIKTFIVMS